MPIQANMGQAAYNDPLNNLPSSSGEQLRTEWYRRKALIETVPEMVMTRLANPLNMPKHMGKKIKSYVVIPVLDDRNINDQGIDASGATSGFFKQYELLIPLGQRTDAYLSTTKITERVVVNNETYYRLPVRGEGSTQALANTAADLKLDQILKELEVFDTDIATTLTAVLGQAEPWIVNQTNGQAPVGGNLWGSSRDITTILDKLPLVPEHGGRVNRIGYTRILREGTFQKFGIFDEYTLELLAFDTMHDWRKHNHREMMRAANRIYEQVLSIDILQNAGIIRFGGDATSSSELTGETNGVASVVSYMDFIKLDLSLTQNGTPTNTRIITGSTNTDTKTIDGERIAFVGSELVPQLRKMKDLHNNPAFIPKRQYLDAGKTVMPGEIGAIANFRIVVIQDFIYWKGAGANVTNNAGYRETGGKYDVFPILVVGSDSFSTISFHTRKGGRSKFITQHYKPKASVIDPYGETGGRSMKWYYGFLAERPERIALMKVVAQY